MASLPTPDSIKDMPRSGIRLQPAAKPLSTYQGGTRDDVPEPPQDNLYAQLGRALSSSSSTMNHAVAYTADIKKEKDTAIGDVAGQRAAHDKTVKDINDMRSKGYLPEGASPTSIFAANTNFAKLRGEQSSMRFREDYYNNEEVRNSEKTGAFEAFAEKWRQDNEKATLQNDDGSPRFSALELSSSNFYQKVDDGIKGVQSEHIAHRVSENAKFAKQTASTLATTYLEKTLKTGVDLIPTEKRDYRAMGASVRDAYYGQTGQVSYGGMDKSEAAKAMAEVIIDKAVAENDPDILRIADYIETPGGVLGNSATTFKGPANEAKLKIAGNIYQDEIRKEQIGKMKVEGTHEVRMQRHLTNFAFTQHEEQKKMFVEAGTARVLNYPDLQHMTPEQLREQATVLDIMRQGAPEETMKLSHTIAAAKEHWQQQADKENFPLAEMHFWNAMLKDPGSPATNAMIDQGLKDRRYTGEEWHRLRAESDRAGQDKMKFAHILNNKLYTNLEDNVGKAVYKDPEHPLGAESVYAGQAMFEFRMRAIAFATANPNANAVDVATVMEPQLETIAKRYNKTASILIDSEHEMEKGRQAIIKEALRLSQEEVQKEIAGQVKKAEVQTQQFKAFDKGEGPDPRTTVKQPPKDFNTALSPANENRFQAWKSKMAPKDSGQDYDLRGAFKAGLTPDPKTGHWPDTFKKPNHPTFSDQSQYAKFGKPGRWEGETFIPAK